jgi:carnitine monooxygenase subunit
MSDLPTFERPLTDDANSAFTLPSAYYLNEEIFELEKEKIFYRSWQYVAHKCMLPNPGDYITLQIGDENIFVIHSSDGEFRAFYNVCKHRAHQLLEGTGNVRKLIVCPYHAWSYDDMGFLKSARMSEHRTDFDKDSFGLSEIRLEILCGCLFVNLGSKAESLNDTVPGLETDIRKHLDYIDEIELCGTDIMGETMLDAGWKVVVDNYVECYHCRPAHPDFSSIINMNQYQVDLHKNWSRQYGPEIRHENTAYPVNPEEGVQNSIFWYMWPNTTFNVMPGSNEFAVFAVRPISKEKCSFGGQNFAVNAELYQPRVDYVADVLAPEDINLCESVQRGLNSRSYNQGCFMVDPNKPGESEHALHQFHQMVYRALSEG